MADDPGSSSSGSSNGENSLITDMSHDHLFSILLLLPLESILSFAMTCKKTLLLTRSQTLWKSICARDWGHSTLDACSPSLDWIQLYRRLRNLDRVSCFNLDASDAPTPRASHSLNFFKGCLLLFGGGCDGGRHLDDTWIAYLGKRVVNWQRVAASAGPSGRFGHSCVVIGNSLVLFGGINDSGIRQNDTWIAQESNTTLSWRLLDVGPLAPPARGAHACSSIDNRRMLIHGGIGLSGTRLGDTWVLYLSENLCFGTWHETLSHPVPSPRSGHTLTSIGGSRTVLFGGRGMGYEVLNDVWYFDSSEGRLGWVPVLFEPRNVPGGISLARVGHSATLISGGRVLIYGGEDSYRHRKDDFWLLDITRRRVWRRVKCEGYQPRSRSFHRASADESGCYLYVFGGMVDGTLQPAEPTGLRFDGELFVVELLV
ncbi:F-box/kelch-repeat protein At1g51550 [Helianthus annuus]|nr:F-box/kelch-repeat protein At1g51550 [Helianthus annuus]